MGDERFSDEDDRELSILIVEFMDTCIGIDTAQVTEICEPEIAEKQGLEIVHLHEKIPGVSDKISYRQPRVVMVRHEEATAGIVIDMPQAIVSLPPSSILPLPDVIELNKDCTPVWGVALHNKRIVLLIDLFFLINVGKM